MKYINFDDSFLEVINPKNNLKNANKIKVGMVLTL